MCDEGGNCVQLVVQRVPNFGSEIADSVSMWRVEGMLAQEYGIRCPKHIPDGVSVR